MISLKNQWHLVILELEKIYLFFLELDSPSYSIETVSAESMHTILYIYIYIYIHIHTGRHALIIFEGAQVGGWGDGG